MTHELLHRCHDRIPRTRVREGELGRPIVISRELANHTTRPVEVVGTFERKGVDGAVEVLAPQRSL